MIEIEYIQAVKDGNGNPRRGWIVTVPNGTVFIDEGFSGMSAIYEWLGSPQHSNTWCTCESCWNLGCDIFWTYVHLEVRKVKVAEYLAQKYSS